jgi:hypothetical protein
MFRRIWAFIVGAFFGLIAGVLIGFIAYPYVFAPPTATETLSGAEGARVAKGMFIHADPSDPVHWGKGEVSVYDREVFLEPSFEVGPGPAYFVYLVKQGGIRTNEAFKAAETVELGKIKSFAGSQRYPIPAGVNPADYKSVVVWCKTFGVLISPADVSRP